MRTITLDLRNVQNEDGLHDLLHDSFGLPAFYGRNLNAFWDCLSEIFEPTIVRVIGRRFPASVAPVVEEYLGLLEEYALLRNGLFRVVREPGTGNQEGEQI